MKKRIAATLLVLVMVLALCAPAMAFEPGSNFNGYDGNHVLQRGDLAGLSDVPAGLEDAAADQEVTQQEVAAFLLRYAGMKDSQLGAYPGDYNAMAESVGLTAGLIYDPTAPCTVNDFNTMLNNVSALYDALHAEEKAPLFVNGMAQPIFDYDEAIRFCVYVETNYDTDGDGKLDLVKALVQLPGAVLDGMKVASVYEARPYIAGTNNSSSSIPSSVIGGRTGYDINALYARPAARTPAGAAATAEAAAAANSNDWDYYYKGDKSSANEHVFEDLNWYDYYLVRGFAVVESAGIGTKGSEGFETCGSDLEIDAFKCVIEWLSGDRAAYTDKTSNIEIKADWSNGNVGMTGRSYAGTTQFGLAATGVEGLKTIVPVAGIASWYEYTNSQGISVRSNVYYTEGLAWYCASRYDDAADYATIADKYGNYLYQLRQDQRDLNGDYGDHWANRDYTADWANIKCPALIVHGVNDDNVRTKQSDLMYKAYAKAGQNVKLLLHQGAHMTPTYPSGQYEMYIDDLLYDQVLNKWFSHYLYGVDNGAENMPAVTSQSNVDGSWETYDNWETGKALTISAGDSADEATTTINSAHSTNGITSSNWKSKFTAGSTASSAMYAMGITDDTTIKGAVEVHIKAAPANYGAAAARFSFDADDADRELIEHYNSLVPDSFDTAANTMAEAIVADALADTADAAAATISKGDAVMMSAMLVDIDNNGFMAYAGPTTSQVPTTTLKTGGAWMGGGLDNYNLVEFAQSKVTYKIIARGWMDLYNPNAGYDSRTASERTELREGEFYDYTLHLQPNLYTVKEGHTLALIIYTYEPGFGTYSTAQNYAITIDNGATFASIPVDKLAAAQTTHKVEFVWTDGYTVMGTLNIKDGGTINTEDVPAIDPGKTKIVKSWLLAENGNPFNLATPITQDYRLMPWQVEDYVAEPDTELTHTVKFLWTDGVTVLSLHNIEDGGYLDMAAVPELNEDGTKKIMSWLIADSGNPFDLGTRIHQDYSLMPWIVEDNLPVDPDPEAPQIVITGVSTGNGQANVNFDVASANGKGYTVYLSASGVEGTFKPYGDVNYNANGAHIKKLTNGQTCYVYIEYADGSGNLSRSDIFTLTPSK